MKNKSQKAAERAEGAPDDEGLAVAAVAKAAAVAGVDPLAVKKGGQVAEKERSDGNIGDDDVVVDAEVFGAKELGGCGYGDGSNGACAETNNSGTDVEGETGPAEE
ncbi:hypothetical protein U1Q18_020687 [Sarracenia purpurea var. burkii]